MKRKIEIGKIAVNGKRKINVVEVDIDLKLNKDNMFVFSSSATVWNGTRSDCVIAGQCLDDLLQYPEIRNNSTFRKIHGLWQRNHLNDMNAGTKEQTEAIDAYLKNNGNKRYDYNDVCKFLKLNNLYEVIHNDKPYKYGHGWIYRDISEEDISEIIGLLNPQI